MQFSYQAFLLSLAAAFPVLGGAGFAFGVLHKKLNPDVATTELGAWITVLASMAVLLFSGSRKKQLDFALNALSSETKWWFYAQRGCSFLTYAMGRLFLYDIGKTLLVILLAAGIYTGIMAADPAGPELLFLAYMLACPLLVAATKICLDATILLSRYRRLVGIRSTLLKNIAILLLATCVIVIIAFFGEFLWQFSYENSGSTDMFAQLALQFEQRSYAIVLIFALIIAFTVVNIKTFAGLQRVSWVNMTERELRRTPPFRRKSALPGSWFKAITIADGRRSCRSWRERAVPIIRTVPLTCLLFIGGAFFILNGGAEALPEELPPTTVIPYGLGLSAIFLALSLTSLFLMDADRHAYALWRTTDAGFQRVLMVRSIVFSFLPHSITMFLSTVFVAVTNLWDMYALLILPIAAGAFLGAFSLLLVSIRWPKTGWTQTADIGFGTPYFIANAIISIIVLIIAATVPPLTQSPPTIVLLSILLFIIVPVTTAGACLVGYRLLRKGIKEC